MKPDTDLSKMTDEQLAAEHKQIEDSMLKLTASQYTEAINRRSQIEAEQQRRDAKKPKKQEKKADKK